MLWKSMRPNSKALYFVGCVTVACAQTSAAGSLAAVNGLNDTHFPLSEDLLEPTLGGQLRHGHTLNL